MAGREHNARSNLDHLIYEISRRYFTEKGMTIEVLANEYECDSNKIRRAISKAKDTGMVVTMVVPPYAPDELGILQTRLESCFGLKRAIVVPGDQSVMNQVGGAEKEAILISCAKAAADYLTNSMRNGNILGVPWGRVASYVSRFLRAPDWDLSEVTIVPIVGVMSSEIMFPYEANYISAQIAATFGSQSLQLACPALIDSDSFDTVCNQRLVKQTLSLLDNVSVALTPIGAPNPETSTIVQKHLASPDEVRTRVDQGAVGEICSHWWFDNSGKEIKSPDWRPVGLGLKGMRNIVEKPDGRVIAVVAGSQERILPLKIAVKNGLVNVVCCDAVTAVELLKDE